MSRARLGNQHLKGHKHSDETLRRMSEAKRGHRNAAYVDGNSRGRHGERRIAAMQLEYKLWRRDVLKRDNYTCQACGKRGGALQADHIKPWATHPALRYDMSNGRALCSPCHLKQPTHGAGALCTR